MAPGVNDSGCLAGGMRVEPETRLQPDQGPLIHDWEFIGVTAPLDLPDFESQGWLQVSVNDCNDLKIHVLRRRRK